MASFTSPFLYFVSLEWPFFILALITYLTVFYLSGWKDFMNMW